MFRSRVAGPVVLLGAILGVMVWFNFGSVDRPDQNAAAQCRRLYAQARSAADSARIDSQRLGRPGQPLAAHDLSCSAFRDLERQLADTAGPHP